MSARVYFSATIGAPVCVDSDHIESNCTAPIQRGPWEGRVGKGARVNTLCRHEEWHEPWVSTHRAMSDLLRGINGQA